MKKRGVFALVVLIAVTVPCVLARPDPMANIKVWPLGTTENPTGDPIVTTSPAEMWIFTTSQQHAAHNVWLLLVLNEDTHSGLNYIDVDGVTYAQADFTLVTEHKIPPLDPDLTQTPPYPGCTPNEQYAVGSTQNKLGTTGDMYSSIKRVFDYVDTLPIEFTITVYLSASVSDLKVLVLALGRTLDPLDGPFDNHSSYTQSTLIVPELATSILAGTSFAALGIYAIKSRKRQNQKQT